MDNTGHHYPPSFSWDEIDLVFLDMDGTILDKYFDDYFWEHYVPEVFAQKNGASLEQARDKLLSTYKSVENTLSWTDLDYWSERLGLDIPSLKKDLVHLIAPLPQVDEFFSHIKRLGKKVFLVTNAHPKAIEIKLAKVRITDNFERIVCSQEVGAAKEQVEFWYKLEKIISFNKNRTLFADDTEKVLSSAAQYGLKHLVHIANPSSKSPVSYSEQYPSILSLKDLVF